MNLVKGDRSALKGADGVLTRIGGTVNEQRLARSKGDEQRPETTNIFHYSGSAGTLDVRANALGWLSFETEELTSASEDAAR